MSDNSQVKEFEEALRGRLEIPSIGVGRFRASGSWILLMLASESELQRPQIILEVMYRLGISIEDLQKTDKSYLCPFCGSSIYAHGKNDRGGSVCPVPKSKEEE